MVLLARAPEPAFSTSLSLDAMNERPESVFVVVPAFNEVGVIQAVIGPLVGMGYRVVVVDDGSTDGTWNLVKQWPVHKARHPINLGQGAALDTGTQLALAAGAEIIVHFDADGQHQAEDIAALVEPLCRGQSDVALGSRFLRATDAQQVPWSRRVLLRCAVVVNGLLTGIWLSDAHNGLRAFTRAAAEKIRLKENRQAHASEIMIQMREHRLRYTERPTTIGYPPYARAKGQSGWNAISIVMDLALRKIFG